tara:strand:+ start:655 stop:1104 length:450 start_codon:yes stop_codon:yes gene_type:complete
MSIVHGSCIEIGGSAVLLRGASATGKSDLALRLIDTGAVLVSDDRVALRPVGDGIEASPPSSIAGLIEVRGVGIVTTPFVARSRLALVADLVVAPLPRLPEPSTCRIEGVDLPVIVLMPFEASAPAKLRIALATLARGGSLAGSLGDRC